MHDYIAKCALYSEEKSTTTNNLKKKKKKKKKKKRKKESTKRKRAKGKSKLHLIKKEKNPASQSYVVES